MTEETVAYRLYDDPLRCFQAVKRAVDEALAEVAIDGVRHKTDPVVDDGRPAISVKIIGVDYGCWSECHDLGFRRRVGDALPGVRFHILGGADD